MKDLNFMQCTQSFLTINELPQAIHLLQQGKLVAFPTETVYGLGADANNPLAVQAVFTAKARPSTHPLIIHIPNVAAISNWAVEISDTVMELCEHFWPGPLTVILKKAKHVLPLVAAGQDTVALRVPNHPITLALLKDFAGGLVGPSANRFGRISPTCAIDVATELGDQVHAILDGGRCQIGIESTIVLVQENKIHLLRQGSITATEIEAQLHKPVEWLEKPNVRAPGMALSHYAPRHPVRLVATSDLLFTIQQLLTKGLQLSVLSFQAQPTAFDLPWEQMSADPKVYAYNLYASLRNADASTCDYIIVEQTPTDENWYAIQDRLQRAAAL